eukprot:UC1_evm1s323
MSDATVLGGTFEEEEEEEEEEDVLRSFYTDTCMLLDADRNLKYRNAIRNAVATRLSTERARANHSGLSQQECIDCSVLDIGSGTGLLALFAAEAGATTVDTCEMYRPMADIAEHVLEDNRSMRVDPLFSLSDADSIGPASCVMASVDTNGIVADIGSSSNTSSLSGANAHAAAAPPPAATATAAAAAAAAKTLTVSATAVAGGKQVLAVEPILHKCASTELSVASKSQAKEERRQHCGILPRPVDVLVTEIFDSELLGEGVLPTLRHAHAHLLRPGATVVPRAAQVYVQPVESELLRKWHYFGGLPTVNGCHTAPAAWSACPGNGRVLDVHVERLRGHMRTLAQPVCAANFELDVPIPPEA